MKLGLLSFAHLHAYSYADCVKQLEPEVELFGVADEDEERGKKAAEQFQTRYYPDYQELLKEPIEAVIITSENSRHYELTKASAEAGKHVLCEKPISTNLEDGNKMIEVCRDSGVILQICFPCRYSPAVIQGRELVRGGGIGKVLAIKGKNRGKMPGGWFVEKEKSGGGAVIDHTVHIVDLMRWYLGCEVKEVYAEMGRFFHDIPTEDAGMLSLEFEDGTIATLDTSWSRPKSYPTWGDANMEVIGTEGVIFADVFGQVLSLYSDKTMQTSWEFWGDNVDLELIKDFVNTIKTGGEPKITGYDGLKALEVALGAYKSAELKEPVKLPL